MAVLTKDKIIANLTAKLGDDVSDEALALIADVSDTIDDYEAKTRDQTNYKEKYENNDKEWRQKFRDRFKEPVKEDPPGNPPPEEDDKNLTYDKLFKEV